MTFFVHEAPVEPVAAAELVAAAAAVVVAAFPAEAVPVVVTP